MVRALITPFRVLTWMVMIALSFVILWTVLEPWTAARPSEQALLGRWTAHPVPGREVDIVLSQSHVFSSSDWPREVGCSAPTWMATRTPETVEWAEVTEVSALWHLDDNVQGIRLEPSEMDSGRCSLTLTIYAERNLLTGEYRLSVFYAGLDEDYDDDRMTFYRESPGG